LQSIVLFFTLVAINVSVIVLCFVPLVRRRGTIALRVIGAIVGAMLLGANVVPLLALPVVSIVHTISPSAAAIFEPAILFLRTVPAYVANLRDRDSRSATRIDVAYPIKIGAKHFAPVFSTVCGKRRMIFSDKGFAIRESKSALTAVGGDEVVAAGDVLIAVAQGKLCSSAATLLPGPFPDEHPQRWDTPTIYLLSKKSNAAILYHRWLIGDPLAVDDIVISRPEIRRVEVVPGETIPLSALWPVSTPQETAQWRPDFVKELDRTHFLDCIQRVGYGPSMHDKFWKWRRNDSASNDAMLSPDQRAKRKAACEAVMATIRQIPARQIEQAPDAAK
jgi:hypothetical protein